MRKTVYALIAAVAAMGIALPAAASAGTGPIKNITDDCDAVADCGGLVLKSPDLAIAVASSKAKSGTAVIVAVQAPDPTQDFLYTPPANPADGAESMQWAPSGKPSGLCISEPNVDVKTDLVLRKCNGSNFQIWDFVDLGTDGFNVWENLASGFAMSDPSSGPAGTQLKSRTIGAGTAENERWAPLGNGP